mgnify:CR=1 FL=1
MKAETTEATLVSVAADANKYFIRKTRDNGEDYYCTVDDTPEWIMDMVREAHGDKTSDDYVYDWIDTALSDIADGMTEDDVYAHVDNTVDSYTSSLTAWLASDVHRVYYLTEVLEESNVKDGFAALAQAQYREIEEVFSSVLNSIQARVDDLNE